MRYRALIGAAVLIATAGAAISLARLAFPHDAGHDAHASAASAARTTQEARFLAENEMAMSRMMAGMAIKPSGDVDRDFAAMMIPHHQGAIEMAQAELRYGKNEQLRRIAQEIVVEQLQEIDAMRLAAGQGPLPQAAAPTQVETQVDAPLEPPAHDHHTMSGGAATPAGAR
jgi:hypothetical protein